MKPSDLMIQYCNDIADNKIAACVKHKWACKRFIDDLQKIGSWDWVFDEEAAQHYFDWMRLFKHSQGYLAGQPKIPDPYEIFVYGNIYGWKHKETGDRRFRRSYEQIGRKNAKSQDKGIQALFELGEFSKAKVEVYVCATVKKQTRFVWGEANWLYQHSILKDKFTTKYDEDFDDKVIKHKKSGSIFARLTSEDKKKGDGPNPHFLILDEYHLQEDTSFYDLGASGQKVLQNPLMSIISTAGFDLNNPCFRVEYKYISSILNPDDPLNNDEYFAIVCELDRNESYEKITINNRVIEPGEIIDDYVNDKSCWPKANPIIGNTPVGIKNIEYDVKESEGKPEKKRDLITKTFNIWIMQREFGYMDLSKWNRCVNKDRDLSGQSCILGGDFSSKLDLTSTTFEFYIDEKYILRNHSFIPEAKMWEKIQNDKIPYDLWAKQGWITPVPGSVIDINFIKEYWEETASKNNWYIVEYCFDPWGCMQLMGELRDEGHTVVEVVQGVKTLSEPTKNFRDEVYLGNVEHDGNPVLTFAVGNALAEKVGRNENILLNKNKSKQRIDPLTSAINAHTRAMFKEFSLQSGGRVFFV